MNSWLKYAVYVLAVLTALVLGGLAFMFFGDKEPPSPAPGIEFGPSITIMGTGACLPFKDKAAPSPECKWGLKTQDGKYYDVAYAREGDESLKLPDDGAVATITAIPVPLDPQTEWDVAGRLSIESVAK